MTSALATSKAVQSKQVSCREATEAALRRIGEVDGEVKAFLKVTADQALARADALDKRLAKGEDPGPLTGVPIAVKDVMSTRGIETTCASKILKGYVPPYDADTVERLTTAGAVIVGKTNLDEFAMGSSTENSGYFTTHNPWDLARVPGGSSGGSAAAVAAGEALLGIGTDTGGSVRQPAALCGIVGLKPTYGRVSRYGLIAFASSLDQVGPLANDVRDCALLLGVIAGHDRHDSTSVDVPVPDYVAGLGQDIKGLRVGIARDLFEVEGVSTDAPARDAVLAAAKVLEGQGASLSEVALPHAKYGVPVYYLIAPSEASSNLARYDGVEYPHRTAQPVNDIIELYSKTRAEGFGPEVKRRIMLGTYALSAGYYDAFYLKASQVRTLIRRDFEQAFEQCDVILSPTAPGPAFRIGEKADDPYQMYLSDVCTIPVPLAGLPALSVPCGYEDDLPLGLQIIGPAFREDLILRVGYHFEQATTHHARTLTALETHNGRRSVVRRADS